MPIFTLDATTPSVTTPLNPKIGEYTVACAGTWSGTITFGFLIDGEAGDYTDGVYAASPFDFVFHPATDFTTITLAGTGEAKIQITPSKWAK